MISWNVQKTLWEKVDEDWNSCLRVASAESWLLLPSGVVKVRDRVQSGNAVDKNCSFSYMQMDERSLPVT